MTMATMRPTYCLLDMVVQEWLKGVVIQHPLLPLDATIVAEDELVSTHGQTFGNDLVPRRRV
jgi:hypothetical protein